MFAVLKRFYITTATLLLNTALLFVILNILSAGILKVSFQAPSESNATYWLHRMDFEGSDFLRKTLYQDKYTDEEIKSLRNRTEIRYYPMVRYTMAPQRSALVNVGFENIRYHKYANEDNVRDIINGSTWVFGGSTTWGDGVGDNDTIPYYLSELDPNDTYLNFAVCSMGQNLEIEKLLLLLRKGYRPKRVIFVDGVNDENKTLFHPLSEGVPAEKRFAPKNIFIDKYLRKLPLFDLLWNIKLKRDIRHFVNKYADTLDIGELSSPDSDFLTHPAAILHLEKNYRYLSLSNHYNYAQSSEKVVTRFRLNTEFLQQLSQSFGFDYYIFHQPMGTLNPNHPLSKDFDEWMRTKAYKHRLHLKNRISKAIQNGELPRIYDISDIDIQTGNNNYLDSVHYGPSLCKLIAKTILDTIEVHKKQ